jgi:hypothetical protein
MSVVSYESFDFGVCLVMRYFDVVGKFLFANAIVDVDEDSEREEVAEAREDGYYDGREDQAYEDDGGW